MIAFCNFFSTWWNLNFNTRYLVEIQTKKKKMFWCNNYKLHKLNSHWQLLEWEQGEIHYVYLMESLLSTWHSNVMKEKLHWIGSCTVVEFMGKCFTTLSAVRLKPMSLPLITINSWKQYFISMNAKSIGKRVNLGFWSTFFTNSEAVGASYFKQSLWSKVGKKRSDFFKMLLSCYKFQFKCYISLVKIQNCHILFRNVTTEIFLLRPLQWWAESAPLGLG